MDEINKLLERIESDLVSDGYVDSNVVLKDIKKVRELAMNYTRCCRVVVCDYCDGYGYVIMNGNSKVFCKKCK